MQFLGADLDRLKRELWEWSSLEDSDAHPGLRTTVLVRRGKETNIQNEVIVFVIGTMKK